jgi:putative ABC transport system ATP-binding protein
MRLFKRCFDCNFAAKTSVYRKVTYCSGATSSMAQNGNVVIHTRDLAKDLPLGKTVVHALRGVDMDIYAGEIVGIVGPSGSGKSTLLGLIGGLDKPTRGAIEIDGTDISRMNEDQLTEIRNEKIGFIFQFFNLIPTLTALENVMLPIQFARKARFSSDKRARELLTSLGLGDRLHHRPSELSGGQQQRVAIARALANDPPLLLADEPTGNLDQESGAIVLQALQDIRERAGTAVVIVTHDHDLASHADRILTLVDGQLEPSTVKV